MSALNKAVFLDRDGVLCEDTDYITSFEKLHIYPFAKKAVEQIHKKGYLVIVVTNQSGVARGYLTEEMLQKLNAYLQKETGKVISRNENGFCQRTEMQRAAGFCSFKCLGICQKYKRLRKQIPLARG